MDALARNQGGLADGLEGVGDDPNPLLGQAGEGALIGRPAGKQMDFLGVDGVPERGENVGQRALTARQQRLDHFNPEAGRAPAAGGDQQPRELSEMGAFEIDDRRPNLPGEAFFGLSVEGRPGDRGGRPRRQERSGPDKKLVHVAILAWTSANWVAQ